jgi:hypothetical protein
MFLKHTLPILLIMSKIQNTPIRVTILSFLMDIDIRIFDQAFRLSVKDGILKVLL